MGPPPQRTDTRCSTRLRGVLQATRLSKSPLDRTPGLPDNQGGGDHRTAKIYQVQHQNGGLHLKGDWKQESTDLCAYS
jgi:hypothetical protein